MSVNLGSVELTDLKLSIGSEERCGAPCSSEKDMSRLRGTSVLINKLVSHTKMIGFSLTLSWCHAKAASGNLRLQQHTQRVPCTCFGLRSVQLGRRGTVAAAVAAVSFEKAVPLLLQSDLLISARGNFKERISEEEVTTPSLLQSTFRVSEFTVTRRREAESIDQ